MNRVAIGLAVALAAVAYRALWIGAFELPTAHRVETWLFRPSQLPLSLVLAVATWLVWRRRTRLAAPNPGRPLPAALGLALGASLYIWAALTRAPDLLLLSLAANLIAVGILAGGGASALRLPALVLLLGVRIPAPVRNEIVWALQRATAFGAANLLSPLRDDIAREGVILRTAEHSFHVIDGCSGLQGIAILVLMAVIVGELLELAPRRRIALALVALPLGYALNAVRIAYIAGSSNPEAYAGLHGDHTPQGLALLAVGTALLYVLGRALPGSTPSRPVAAEAMRAPWPAAALFAGLAVLSFALPPFAPRQGVQEPRVVPFPDEQAGWTSEAISGDPYFFAVQVPGQLLYRRYARGDSTQLIDVVDVLVAMDGGEPLDASEFFSTKLRWPGPDWNLDRQRVARLWEIGRDAELAIGTRPARPERAVIYSFRVRDGGLWRESLRALFALESSPWRRERKRVAVRLVAFAPFDEPLAIDRAKQRLDRFVSLFRDDFSAL